MSTLSVPSLLQELAPLETVETPAPSVLDELVQLARAIDVLPERARMLYRLLRKLIGQPNLHQYLTGVAVLAQRNDPAGARLLAALLDSATPGARLIPRIHSYSSSRRLRHRLGHADALPPELRNWQSRLLTLRRACRKRSAGLANPSDSAPGPADEEAGFLDFRHCLRSLVASLYRQEGELSAADTTLLVDLARLEVDAYQERISHLAGQVNPYRVTSVSRLLPLLRSADTEIRDLRHFIAAVEQGHVQQAFHARQLRMDEVLEPPEREAFLLSVRKDARLAPLVELLERSRPNPVPVPQMAASSARLMALVHQLRIHGWKMRGLDLLSAVLMVQRSGMEGELRFRLQQDQLGSLREILATPRKSGGMASWPLDGFRITDRQLILQLSGLEQARGAWKDDLPSLAADRQTEPEEPAPADDAHAIKQLVFANIGSVSVLQGLLRNPKIVGIPGLIVEVVQRCRSLLILDQIANDRRLYSGYANKDVPRALLRSPCNISIRTIRKFIHVKYIDKIELQRMVKDKTGLRDEVVKEITRYLKSLQ